MKAMWVLLIGVLVWGCVESNPQPSPAGPDVWNIADLGGGTDVSDEELVADLVPHDVVPADTTDTSPPADVADTVDTDIPCIPDCEGRECGADGCGGSCGDCREDGLCWQGQCDEPCFPPGEEPVFSETVQKLNHLEIGAGGLPGYALDLDGDPDTCAPEGMCQDGLHNALGFISGQFDTYFDVNAALREGLEAGTITLLFEVVEPTLDGAPFRLNFYLGAPVEDRQTCDWQAEACDYLVDDISYNWGTCTPLISFDDTALDDGHLTAGGPDGLFSVSFDIGGVQLPLLMYAARLEATAVISGDVIEGLVDGVIGGALDKEEVLGICTTLPEEFFEETGIGVGMMCDMLDMFIVPDIDRDDDGVPESASLGIAFTAIPGHIIGVGE